MSISQYQREVNQIDKEIVSLEAKKAEAVKKSASYQSKIHDIQKSITKSISPSMLNSKQRSIETYTRELDKYLKESAEYEKKIAALRKRRGEKYLRLQKAQQDESNQQLKTIQAQTMEMQRMRQDYEARIDALTNVFTQDDAVLDDAEKSDEEYDAFVSHASEDKEDFVDEFVHEMRELDIKVWYDTTELKWGDSLRQRIDDGLRKSRFGIVVLSPNYIAEGKYWTKAELNGIFQLDSINGKVLLPIWHGLSKKQVIEYSPIIADRKAMTTANMTAKEIAEAMKQLITPE